MRRQWIAHSRTQCSLLGFEPLEDRRMLAAMPELLIDLGYSERDSLAQNVKYATIGDQTYFVADDGGRDQELWVTDGTTQGTRSVRPGVTSVGNLTNAGGVLYFTGGMKGETAFLWKSDGTERGTVPIKAGDDYVEAYDVIALKDTVFFTWWNSSLWCTDGTSDGTFELTRFGSSPNFYAAVGDNFYFTADLPDGGSGLWKSDGTQLGTVLVKSLSLEGRSGVQDYAVMGDVLYFSASEASTGNELWRTDGTPAGTYRVRDIYTGSGSSTLSWMTVIDDTLFFAANSPGHGTELWRSDGTEAGTSLVTDIASGASSSDLRGMVQVADELYFFARATSYLQLWKSDGTAAGTMQIHDAGGSPVDYFAGYDPAAINGVLYFSAYDNAHWLQLWTSDGTPSGTHRISDISSDHGGASPYGFMPTRGGVLFAADDDEIGRELWRSDGTPEGTTLVKNINTSRIDDADVSEFTDVNGLAFFVGSSYESGLEVWKSDGTRAGTSLLRDIYPGEEGSGPEFLTNVNGMLYFVASDGTHGFELWKSDGTSEGTVPVTNFPADVSPAIRNLVNVGGTLYFVANDGVHGDELWKSDGTPAGTVLAAEIRSGAVGSNPMNLLNAGGVLYFAANDGIHGSELWTSNGTAAGTVLVKDINPSGNANIASLSYRNGTLFFGADDGTHGSELWRSDGTSEGTYLLKDIRAGGPKSHTSFGVFVDVNGLIYFNIASSTGSISRYEIWLTDGSAAGTRFVAGASSDVLASFKNKVLFDREGLYSVDAMGQPEFVSWTTAHEIVIAADTAYLLSQNGIWATDGTLIGSVKLDAEWRDSDTYNSNPIGLTAIGGKLFYSAYHRTTGRDPWVVPLVSQPAVLKAHVFYNNSVFDGYTPGVSEVDASAIAPDLGPMRLKIGRIEDYESVISSYAKGINGIMVDLVNPAQRLTADDFRFQVQVPDGNDFRWVDGPSPSQVDFEAASGILGSDRVVIVWPDSTIVDRWLRVIVKGNDLAGGYATNSGLKESDVLYFANKIGDTRGSDFHFFDGKAFATTAADVAAVFANGTRRASAANPFDFNRDGQVNSTDAAIALSHLGAMSGDRSITAEDYLDLLAYGQIKAMEPHAAVPRESPLATAARSLASQQLGSQSNATGGQTWSVNLPNEFETEELGEDMLDLLCQRANSLRRLRFKSA